MTNLPLPPTETETLPQTPEPNPLTAIAGSYANDPNWDKLLQDLEESRREMDAEGESG